MKLEKAIEILENLTRETGVYIKGDEIDAIELGTETLTFLVRWRDEAEIKPYPLLPSETTD